MRKLTMQWRCPGLVSGLLAVLLAALPAHVMADTVLITGANSGIGLEFTKQYASQGWTVIATHRRSEVPASLAEVIAKFKNVQVEQMDITNQSQVLALAAKLKDTPIDVLINNAGVYNDRSECKDDDCPGNCSNLSFGNLNYPLFDTIMAVNVKGPLQVAEAFLENVKASRQKKIVSISSTNGSLTEQLPGSGAIFYRSSKAALNRAMQLVATEEKKDGVIVLLMHPGAVLTERQAYLAKYEGMVKMPFTVENMIKTIAKVTIEDSGRFLQYDGTSVPW